MAPPVAVHILLPGNIFHLPPVFILTKLKAVFIRSNCNSLYINTENDEISQNAMQFFLPIMIFLAMRGHITNIPASTEKKNALLQMHWLSWQTHWRLTPII
jgi:hypothetical protein